MVRTSAATDKNVPTRNDSPAGLKFQRADMLPPRSTPNTSRTLVNRSKHPLNPVAKSTHRNDSNSKKRKAIIAEADSDDSEEEQDSGGSSNEEDCSDGRDELLLSNQRTSKKIKPSTVPPVRNGKENDATVGKRGVIKANEPSRKFGQGKSQYCSCNDIMS